MDSFNQLAIAPWDMESSGMTYDSTYADVIV